MFRSRIRPLGQTPALLALSLVGACAPAANAPPATDVADDPAEPAAGGLVLGPEGQSHFADCYEPARLVRPDVSVNTPMLFFGRGGKIVFAYLELPDRDRALGQCLRQKVVGWALPGPDASPESISSGGMLVQLGPVSGPPSGPRTRDEILALLQRAREAAVAEGVFEPDDPALDKLRAGP